MSCTCGPAGGGTPALPPPTSASPPGGPGGGTTETQSTPEAPTGGADDAKRGADTPTAAKDSSTPKPDKEPPSAASKQATDGGKYLRPVDGAITGKWKSRSSLRAGPHTGVDFRASAGTPIRAAADGVVHSAGTAGAFGKETIIRHADGRYTQYAHQSRFAPGIREGAKVTRGQVIGYVGTTGNTSGAHLHFEVRTAPGFKRNVNDVDPMRFLE